MGIPPAPAHTIRQAVTARICISATRSEGKVHSVYVPAELGESLREAQEAWHEFQQIGTEISADNRERLLSSLEREKQLVRAKRSRGRKA